MEIDIRVPQKTANLKICGMEATNLVSKKKRLNVGRIALERLVGALINCSPLQSSEGRKEGGGA